MNNLNRVFQLGKKLVVYPSDTETFVLRKLNVLLPSVPDSDDNREDRLVITADVSDVESAFCAACNAVLLQFEGDLWLDACALIAPNGSSVMLAGASFSGKSTLAIALAQSGWKLVSEDITFILKNGTIPVTPKPISLRNGARELIEQATKKPLRLVDCKWHFEPASYAESNIVGPVDAIVLLHEIVPYVANTIAVNEIVAEAMARELIPQSNGLLLTDDTLPKLYDFVRNARSCWSMHQGTISERIIAVETIVEHR